MTTARTDRPAREWRKGEQPPRDEIRPGSVWLLGALATLPHRGPLRYVRIIGHASNPAHGQRRTVEIEPVDADGAAIGPRRLLDPRRLCVKVIA